MDKYSVVKSMTPDKITKLGVARTFQNIRLFKNLTVFENVLIAKHMRSKANFLSATFRLNYKEEKQNRDEHVTHKNECAFMGFCVNFLTFRKMTCKVIHNNLRYCNVITTRARCQRGLQF